MKLKTNNFHVKIVPPSDPDVVITLPKPVAESLMLFIGFYSIDALKKLGLPDNDALAMHGIYDSLEDAGLINPSKR